MPKLDINQRCRSHRLLFAVTDSMKSYHRWLLTCGTGDFVLFSTKLGDALEGFNEFPM
jgi:hypothetical protein